MATRTPKTKANPRKVHKEAKLQELAAGGIAGFVITWDTLEGGLYKHAEVVAALKGAGLDEKEAREFIPRNAFARACRKMSEDRFIDVLKEEGDIMTFQFTKKFMDATGEEWKFAKELNLKLNKVTGVIESKNKDVEAKAQQLLNEAMENRTSTDVTTIVQRQFDKHADLFPLRRAGAAYFVPLEHKDFIMKIDTFLRALHGKVNIIPIHAGTGFGEAAIQDAVEQGLSKLIGEYDTSIKNFNIHTQKGTMDGVVDRINEARIKIQAYAHYLGTQKDALEQQLEALNQKLVARVSEVAEEKAKLPEDQRPSRPGVITRIIELLSKATEKKPITKAEILADLKVQFPDRAENAMKSTISSQVPSGLKVEKKIIVHKKGDGFWINGDGKAAK